MRPPGLGLGELLDGNRGRWSGFGYAGSDWGEGVSGLQGLGVGNQGWGGEGPGLEGCVKAEGSGDPSPYPIL